MRLVKTSESWAQPRKTAATTCGASAKRLLFMALRDHNVDAIKESGAKRIVTADPHAFNALKHDYKDLPPVEHISQMIAREVKSGKLKLKRVETGQRLRLSRPLLPGTAQPGLRRSARSARCHSRAEASGDGAAAATVRSAAVAAG